MLKEKYASSPEAEGGSSTNGQARGTTECLTGSLFAEARLRWLNLKPQERSQLHCNVKYMSDLERKE